MTKRGANGPKSRARVRQERDGIKYTAAAAAGPDRLAAALATRSDGALTVERATLRLGLGGKEYRRFLERGRQGVAEALRAALDVPELHPSRPAALRDALAALDRHTVGPEAQDVAGLYWTGRHSEAVSRIWRTPLTAAETADVQAEVDEVLHTAVAVHEYLWPTCHDADPWHPLPGLPDRNRNGAAEPDYGFSGHEF
ncbi:hypothetical protein [Streptomyces noursei]|uniref:hypothetical protein n=1 Tax=Streptomyces noursei TaxID=1971 RepID=UPI0005CADD68